MAPDRWSPTEGNGLDVPPATLHIALVVPNAKAYEYLKDKVSVVAPPYWAGTIHLHMIPDDPKSKWHGIDWVIRQALTDSGLATPEQIEFTPPEQVTLGWPRSEENR
jgi:hypothetical protein